MENNKNNNKIWWKPAFEIFSEISTWIAVPIILAVIGGKALDSHYGTKPWMFIGSVILAFLISSYGIVKAVKKYAVRIKKEDKENKNI
ncbi:MAG: AtpZ/AtpI family protein [Candidatus Paceibacterota bacterium]|jgi:F0F1-type ATP synthase assembly protein I